MVTVTIVCAGVCSKLQTVQLQRQRETISIHKQCITWYEVERTNVFNNLWHREVSLCHMFKVHTHIHIHTQRHIINMHLCLYWFSPGPGNILNVTFYFFISLSLALCGGRPQQESRDHQFREKWRNMLFLRSTFLLSARRQKDDKC